MAIETQRGRAGPGDGFRLVGALGVGAQWLAWRVRMPAIVLMLLAGLAVGPGLGLFDPARDIGPLMGPMIGHRCGDHPVRGRPDPQPAQLARARRRGCGGWFSSARRWAGSARRWRCTMPPGWIGPRRRIRRHHDRDRPHRDRAAFAAGASERAPGATAAMGGDRQRPVGALAAVLAFEVVLVMAATETAGGAALSTSARGIAVALVLGLGAGWGIWPRVPAGLCAGIHEGAGALCRAAGCLCPVGLRVA